MKTEGQVKQKAKMVIFRHRKAYIQQGLSRRPENCSYNRRVHLPAHTANRATIGVCGYCADGLPPNDIVCDSTMGGDPQAEKCAFFQKRHSAEDLKSEFNHKLGIDGGIPREIGYIAKEFPDVAALLWVMGPSKNVNREEPEEEEDPQGNILAFFGDGEEPEDLPERPLVEEPEATDGDA